VQYNPITCSADGKDVEREVTDPARAFKGERWKVAGVINSQHRRCDCGGHPTQKKGKAKKIRPISLSHSSLDYLPFVTWTWFQG
jgi:hypothetical protein